MCQFHFCYKHDLVCSRELRLSEYKRPRLTYRSRACRRRRGNLQRSSQSHPKKCSRPCSNHSSSWWTAGGNTITVILNVRDWHLKSVCDIWSCTLLRKWECRARNRQSHCHSKELALRVGISTFLTYIHHLFNVFGDGGGIQAWSQSRSPLCNHGRLHWSYGLQKKCG